MSPKALYPEASPISFWLVPSEPDRGDLAMLINRLADEYRAPRFLPHVTLLSTQLAKDESSLHVLESATKGITPLELEVLGLDHGPDRFKSIFIRLNSGPIVPLNAALRAFCRYPDSFQLDAHMSLLYLQLPVKKRLSLTSGLQLPQESIRFDSIVAVKPGHDQICFEDVEKWRLVDQVYLTASKSIR